MGRVNSVREDRAGEADIACGAMFKLTQGQAQQQKAQEASAPKNQKLRLDSSLNQEKSTLCDIPSASLVRPAIIRSWSRIWSALRTARSET